MIYRVETVERAAILLAILREESGELRTCIDTAVQCARVMDGDGARRAFVRFESIGEQFGAHPDEDLFLMACGFLAAAP